VRITISGRAKTNRHQSSQRWLARYQPILTVHVRVHRHRVACALCKRLRAARLRLSNDAAAAAAAGVRNGFTRHRRMRMYGDGRTVQRKG
jgi:hypothetical protein